MTDSAETTLFIDPGSADFEQDRLFDLDTSRLCGHDVLAPYLYLQEWMRERGVTVRTADALDRGEALGEHNIYVSMGMRRRYPSLVGRDDVTLSAFLALEAPIVEPKLYLALDDASRAFRRMLSFSTTDALRPFLSARVAVEQFQIPQSFDAVHEEIWAARGGRKMVTIINANKLPRIDTYELYRERLRAIEFFERHGEIDLYGTGWDGPPFRMGETWIPGTVRRAQRRLTAAWQRLRPPALLPAAGRAWRGVADDKATTLGRYRFAICFENMELEGYITEKLFDCLYSGTVPVYLGAPDIERWVPGECFIDMRRFSGYEDLREFMHSLGPAEVEAYREAGRAFIGSDRFRPFSRLAFAELFGRIVEEDAGVCLEPRRRALLSGSLPP